MIIDIRREDHQRLAEYAAISAAFDVHSALRSPAPGVVHRPLPRRDIRPAYRKDYDAIPGNHALDWPARFAVDRACWLAAYGDGERLGGALVILAPDEITRMGGEPGHALLWDLRVATHARGAGIGRALLAAAVAAAREAGFVGITAETQDINIAACEAYAAAAFVIDRVDVGAYPELPDETRLVWTRRFDRHGAFNGNWESNPDADERE